MTLKTNATRITLTPPAMVAGVYAIIRGYWWIYDKPVDVTAVFLIALALSLVFGLFFAMISPKEISWDERQCTILSRLGSSGTYGWNELEGWSPYQVRGMFLLKFHADQTYQVPSFILPSKKWKVFHDFLDQHCSDKKALVWVNLIPRR